jgi:hypothetical protein
VSCWRPRQSSRSERRRTSRGALSRERSTPISRRFDGELVAECVSSNVVDTTRASAQVGDRLGGAVVDLLEVLGDLLTTLVRAAEPTPCLAARRDPTPRIRNVGWLRPLAIASAKLEYSVRQWPALHPPALAARCDDLTRLLAASRPIPESDFAERYARERALSPRLAALHTRVLEGCRQVASRCLLLISNDVSGVQRVPIRAGLSTDGAVPEVKPTCSTEEFSHASAHPFVRRTRIK